MGVGELCKLYLHFYQYNSTKAVRSVTAPMHAHKQLEAARYTKICLQETQP